MFKIEDWCLNGTDEPYGDLIFTVDENKQLIPDASVGYHAVDAKRWYFYTPNATSDDTSFQINGVNFEFSADNTIADVDSRIGLLTVANKAMSALPGHRYRDVRAFRQAIRRCLSEHEGKALLKQANGQLAEAQRLGHYELYQQAVADFDAALAAFPENVEALNGRVRALLAFGRQALSNAEYDLALSIIKPEVKASSKAATLAQTITREKAAAELLRRRRKRVNTVLGLMVVSLLLTGAYVAHYRYDIIANLTRSGIDDAGQQNAFLHLKRALENLQRRVHAVTLKANTYNQPELQEIQDLQEQYKSLLPVFNDCIKKFDEEPWDTPARRNRVGLYIRSRIPEIEEGIRRIHSLGEHLSGGRIGEGLEEHIDGMMQQFASVTRYLRGMSLIGT